MSALLHFLDDDNAVYAGDDWEHVVYLGRSLTDAVFNAGSPTVTSVSGLFNSTIHVGAAVQHPLLPDDTTISAVVNATTITLNHAALGSGLSVETGLYVLAYDSTDLVWAGSVRPVPLAPAVTPPAPLAVITVDDGEATGPNALLRLSIARADTARLPVYWAYDVERRNVSDGHVVTYLYGQGLTIPQVTVV